MTAPHRGNLLPVCDLRPSAKDAPPCNEAQDARNEKRGQYRKERAQVRRVARQSAISPRCKGEEAEHDGNAYHTHNPEADNEQVCAIFQEFLESYEDDEERPQIPSHASLLWGDMYCPTNGHCVGKPTTCQSSRPARLRSTTHSYPCKSGVPQSDFSTKQIKRGGHRVCNDRPQFLTNEQREDRR